MKKELKIVLPFYKVAYAISFVVILSLIRGVTYTHEVGIAIEAPFAILTAVFCADTYVQEIRSKRFEVHRTLSLKKEIFFYDKASGNTGIVFVTACGGRIWAVFCFSKTNDTSGDKK